MLSVLDNILVVVVACHGSGRQIKIVSVLFPELSPPPHSQPDTAQPFLCLLFMWINLSRYFPLSDGGQKFCCNCQVRKVWLGPTWGGIIWLPGLAGEKSSTLKGWKRRGEYRIPSEIDGWIVGGNSNQHLVNIKIRLTGSSLEKIKMLQVGYYFMVDYFQKISFREIRINLL